LRGEDLLMELDMRGVCASSGSACSSGANLPSKVLLALGLSEREARDAVRLSLGVSNTAADVDETIAMLRTLLDSPQSR
jgi:cysteine desulfurase